MVRYLKLYNKFLKQYIKTLMEYRADFLLGLIGFILVQGVGIVFIGLVFNSIPTLKGWSFYEILFIYGFAQIPRGIDHVFTDQLWIFSWKTIVQGEFDRYLVRPLNPLFQVICSKLFIYGLSIKYFCKISNNNIPNMDKGSFNFYYSFCFYRLFSSSLYIRKRKLFIRGSAYICSKFYINSYSI